MSTDQDTESAERVDYARRKFDRELENFTDFVKDAYGDELQDMNGDLESAVRTKQDIDVEYVLKDARIEITSDGQKQDDWVTLSVYADDQSYAREIKNIIVSKADGEYDRTVEDGITYAGAFDITPEKENYDTVEPFIGIQNVIRDWFSEKHGYDVTVRPLDDDIDASIGKIKWGRTDGEKYLSEASIDITAEDEEELNLHITQQKSDSDASIQLRFGSEDEDRLTELKRLVHGRYLAEVDITPEDESESLIDTDEFIEDVTDVTMADVGGLEDVKQGMIESIIHPLKYPEESAEMGIEPTNGALFAGPPGTGKTLMAKAIATETGASFYNVDMSKLVSKYVGETEKQIDAVFDHAEQHTPAIVFFDEADTAIPDREQSDKEYSKTMTNTILRRLDGFNSGEGIITIAATNRKADLDEAGYRSGRIDDEYEFTEPDRAGREEILDIKVAQKEAASSKDALFSDLEYDTLADMSAGATGADIEVWVEKAVRNAAYKEGVDLDQPPSVTEVTLNDFVESAETMDFSQEQDEGTRMFQ